MNTRKILCIGNNTTDTDARTRLLAQQQDMTYHGLLTEIKDISSGYYQTSLYDLSYGDLIKLAEVVDDIVILDQPKQSYLDDHTFHQTVSLGKHLKSKCNVVFLDSSLNETIEDTLKTNKSLCILPFIQSVTMNGNFHVCCRSTTPMSKFDNTIGYLADPQRSLVKQKMIAGEKLDRYCKICYDLEDNNIVSPRVTNTNEWSNKLNIKHVSELSELTEPIYYEIRASNQCNLMCRMCSPMWSSLLEKENKEIKIFNNTQYEYTNFDHININKIQKLYVAGGEPTIMPELYKFLEDCVEKKKTSFEIQLNTNAVSLTKKFKSLLEQFSNFKFEISIDGYNLINQYIRWPTNWEKLVSNIDYIHRQKHDISVNLVVSIYNISNLYSIVEFLNNRYKKIPIHLCTVSSDNDILSPYLFPNKALVIADLEKIKSLEVYYNDLVLQSKIDEYLNYFINEHQVDLDRLVSFFKYNDVLDASRDVKLIDYIPELEGCRQLLRSNDD